MTCVYCNDDPAISINCYCRTVTTFQNQPPLDATKLLDQMLEVQKRLDKMHLNTFFPKTASQRSDFYSPSMAREITTAGQAKLEEALYHWTRSAPASFEIVESIHMTVPAEDWSRVRSPGRARRRMKRGYRQNIRYYQKPSSEVFVTDGKIMAHPETIRALTDRVAKEADKQVLNALYGRL